MDTYGGYADSDPIKNALHEVAKRMHVPFINPQKWTAGRDDVALRRLRPPDVRRPRRRWVTGSRRR